MRTVGSLSDVDSTLSRRIFLLVILVLTCTASLGETYHTEEPFRLPTHANHTTVKDGEKQNNYSAYAGQEKMVNMSVTEWSITELAAMGPECWSKISEIYDLLLSWLNVAEENEAETLRDYLLGRKGKAAASPSPSRSSATSKSQWALFIWVAVLIILASGVFILAVKQFGCQMGRPSDAEEGSGELKSMSTIRSISAIEMEWMGGIGVEHDLLPEPTQGSSAMGLMGYIPQLSRTWLFDCSALQYKLSRDGRAIILGTGAFGSVYACILDGVQDVAVKVIHSRDEIQQQRFLQEIALLKACLHPHIVQFLGACICSRTQDTMMVMEFMAGGDLYKKLREDVPFNRSKREFAWYNRGRETALGIIRGLCYLHNLGIAHLDLKSPNILLSRNMTPKIADVGLGMLIGRDPASVAQAGTFFWTSPEQLMGQECGLASDIWAFGTILWEICTGERLNSRFCRPLFVPAEGPQVIQDLICHCHSPNPLHRPTAAEVFVALQAAPH